MSDFPKPQYAKAKRRAARSNMQRAAEMRELVWQRDQGRCRVCGLDVVRPRQAFSFAEVGHVHHRRGRNVAPEDRYNPDAAVLLCAVHHRQIHDGTLTLDVLDYWRGYEGS